MSTVIWCSLESAKNHVEWLNNNIEYWHRERERLLGILNEIQADIQREREELLSLRLIGARIRESVKRRKRFVDTCDCVDARLMRTARYIPPFVRNAVFHRDGNCCKHCGVHADEGHVMHVDHIWPVSKGGSNRMENLQTLCKRCNLKKHDRVAEDLAA